MIKKFILLINIIIFTDIGYAIIINKEEPVYYFTNHEEQIASLRDKLLHYKKVGIIGVTGIGKSEIARKYVTEYQQEYDIIAFLDANIDLIPQLITIAKEINQKICTNTGCHIFEDVHSVKNSLMMYLKSQDRWLLIFDNLHINENDKIKDFIDWNHNGHIIICSQDSKYLLNKILVPYLTEDQSITVINKIMKAQPKEFVTELAENLKGYPTNMISYSAIFLQNNNHMTIKEYINHIQKQDNKIRGYLDAILKDLTPQSKNLLYNIALLNNKKISKNLLEKLVDDKDNLSELIDEIIRFGLIEQTSLDRNKQLFRMHDSIKEELLKIKNITFISQIITNILGKLQGLISGEMVNQFYSIVQDDSFESNLEVLLINADKYNNDINKIMTLKSSLFGYYLRSRDPYNAKKMVNWFKKNESKLKWRNMDEVDKVIYSRYLGRIGRYEYFVVNHHPDIAMEYLLKAKDVIDQVPNNDVAKVAVYYEIFQVQVFTGEIIAAVNNLNTIEKIMANDKKFIHKLSMIDYGKARIFLAQGKYQQALSAIIEMLNKEKTQLNKSRSLVKLNDTIIKQENAWLAPIYTLQVEILNYMQEFSEAYSIAKDVYTMINSDTTGEITSMTLAYNLTELSRAELGVGRKEDALNHAIDAVNILITDKDRGNKENELDNSIDIFLANALVAKADILSFMGQIEEALTNYKLAKNIYWNIYRIENIGNMDNVGYAFAKAARTASHLSDVRDKHTQCFYFYTLLIKYFGSDYFRTKELQGVCP